VREERVTVDGAIDRAPEAGVIATVGADGSAGVDALAEPAARPAVTASRTIRVWLFMEVLLLLRSRPRGLLLPRDAGE
jgi:hypothetical protein